MEVFVFVSKRKQFQVLLKLLVAAPLVKLCSPRPRPLGGPNSPPAPGSPRGSSVVRRLSSTLTAVPLVLTLSLCLAACATSPTSPTGTATESDPGWVELDESFIVDESAFGRVTPAPVEPVAMSQAEAQAQLPFAFALPAWSPDGFVLVDEVEVVQPADGAGYTSVSLTWLNDAEAALHLTVAQAGEDQPSLGAAGTSEAVTVNGQPAALVRTQLLGHERLLLTWPRGDLRYTLTAEAGAATPEILLRMAESIPV